MRFSTFSSFHNSKLPGPLTNRLNYFRFWFGIRRVIPTLSLKICLSPPPPGRSSCRPREACHLSPVCCVLIISILVCRCHQCQSCRQTVSRRFMIQQQLLSFAFDKNSAAIVFVGCCGYLNTAPCEGILTRPKSEGKGPIKETKRGKYFFLPKNKFSQIQVLAGIGGCFRANCKK